MEALHQISMSSECLLAIIRETTIKAVDAYIKKKHLATMSVSEYASEHRISKKTVYNWIAAGKLRKNKQNQIIIE